MANKGINVKLVDINNPEYMKNLAGKIDKGVAGQTAGATGKVLGGIGSALGAATAGLEGFITGSLVDDEAIQSDLAGAQSQGFTIGSTNDLMQLFANTQFAKTNWTTDDIYGGVGKSILNVAGSAVSGLASAGPWGLLAGVPAIAGEVFGAAKRSETVDRANRQAAATNTALVNAFDEAGESTNVLNNFKLKKSLAAEGGPIHKRGTILRVDEDAYNKLIEQGYKVKIID